MNNYEKIKQMSVDEMALRFTAFSAAVIQKCADEISEIAKIERKLLPTTGKKEIFDAIKQWLLSESEEV